MDILPQWLPKPPGILYNYVGHFPDPFPSHWCRHSSYHDRATAMQPWLAFHHTFSSSSSRLLTRLHYSCSFRQDTTASLRFSANCTGWEHWRGSNSSWLFSCTSVCMHGTAPSYLADELEFTADFEARRRLRSASLLSLNVRRTRLSTVGRSVTRWLGLPCCCSPYLEQSASACHVRTLYVCFSWSPQCFSLQAFLPMTFT